jgi:hypothetical protein
VKFASVNGPIERTVQFIYRIKKNDMLGQLLCLYKLEAFLLQNSTVILKLISLIVVIQIYRKHSTVVEEPRS